GTSQINLSWTASTDNVGVTNYLIERQDPGSSTFTQVGATTATSYSSTGLSASSSYNYRVRASDAAGNLSAYSNTASPTTAPAPDTQAPAAPSSLSAAASGTTQINVSWAASTDNVGVASYLIERQDPGSSTFTQVGTTTATSYSSTGLTAASTYTFRVRASD